MTAPTLDTYHPTLDLQAVADALAALTPPKPDPGFELWWALIQDVGDDNPTAAMNLVLDYVTVNYRRVS